MDSPHRVSRLPTVLQHQSEANATKNVTKSDDAGVKKNTSIAALNSTTIAKASNVTVTTATSAARNATTTTATTKAAQATQKADRHDGTKSDKNPVKVDKSEGEAQVAKPLKKEKPKKPYEEKGLPEADGDDLDEEKADEEQKPPVESFARGGVDKFEELTGPKASHNFSHEVPKPVYFPVEEESHALRNLLIFAALLCLVYAALHNKKKILGLIVEGPNTRAGRRAGNVRYRPLSQSDDVEHNAID
ncbi:trans-Golgi network integral membrane protein 2-like protein [Aphelenchoides avenae]|nr:trans-Golgi network integral membrane protein 2-like protein [Aphelenchus avenae]